MRKLTLLAAILLVMSYIPLLPAPDNMESQARNIFNDKVKEKKAVFYNDLGKKLSIDKNDIAAVQRLGYGTNNALVLLLLAKESGKPAGVIAGLTKKGLSWEQICDKYGIDFESFMLRLQATVATNNIILVAPSPEELETEAILMPDSEGGAGQ